MYRHLNIERIVETLVSLGDRIRERFPDSGLSRISKELLEFALESRPRLVKLQRPNWFLRAAVGTVVLAIVAVLATAVRSLEISLRVETVVELVQGIDAAMNELILLAVALFFLLSLEGRLKRRRALGALHELRCIAHVIDMHQLTKDPDAVLSPGMSTPASPRRVLTRFLLSRYLDYCSELLSLTSKLAALHVQHLNDPVVLEAVNDVESLADGLSQKIWQKILVLDTATLRNAAEEAERSLNGIA